MGTATSLTEARILELVQGWVNVASDQEAANAILAELQTYLDQNQAAVDELNAQTIPQLLQDLAANNVLLAELNDQVLPNVLAGVDSHAAILDDINTVTIPNIVADMEANIINVNDRPNVYVQPEAPTNPDENDRYLVVGDSWFDSDNNNSQKIWNGVSWSTFNVNIPDFSLTVAKFKSTSHMLY